MALPKKNANAVRYGKFAARGCLTRLALFFQANGKEKFSGHEIATILVSAVHSIGSLDNQMESHDKSYYGVPDRAQGMEEEERQQKALAS